MNGVRRGGRPTKLPATRGGEFRFQFLLPFVQALQAELPAMQLDAELIDVAGDLSALRLIFLQLMLEIGDFHGVFARGFERCVWYRGWFSALLAIKGHPGGRGVYDERSGTMPASEDNIAARYLDCDSRSGARLHRGLG